MEFHYVYPHTGALLISVLWPRGGICILMAIQPNINPFNTVLKMEKRHFVSELLQY